MSDSPDKPAPATDDPLPGADSDDARREAAVYAARLREDVAALRAEIASLPRQAANILPAPRRVELRPRPVAPETPAPAPSNPIDMPSTAASTPIDAPPAFTSFEETVPPPLAAADAESPSPASEIAPIEKPADPPPILSSPVVETPPPEPPLIAPAPIAETAPAPEDGAALKARRKRAETRGRRAAGIPEAALLASSLGFIGLVGVLYLCFVIVAPRPSDGADLWAINRPAAVIILDRNGAEIESRGARYGEAAKIGELPPSLVRAFLATEDRRFYDHGGVDIRGTMRAILANLRRGAVVEGGSTITQQLARNLFLSQEQTYVRKAKEAMIALWLEGRYSKDQILSFYLNRIYLGAGAYGVESAAQTYFGKSARDLSLPESVMLAGLPKAPSTLAPTLNPFGAADRAKEVLGNMVEAGAITTDEATAAAAAPAKIRQRADELDLGYFFDHVAAEARLLVGAQADDLIIQTTLDQKLQRDAETAVASVIDVEAKVAGAGQAALIAYDKDGAVRAMVGGRSYVESQFNRATQAERQPGSAFKPIVYAAGFESAGLTPRSYMVDKPIDIAGWKPQNYDQKFRGTVRLTEAMARSINTIAVQISEKVGRPKVIEMAHRLGVKSEIPTKEAGIALGAFNATLDELTASYLPYSNGGLGVKPYAILRVSDARGRTLYRHAAKEPQPVVTLDIAKAVTNVLYQVMTVGTGRTARLDDRQAAGKTGTTNDWRDAWFIGYTAQMTAGVWVGNDDFKPMNNVTGGTLPAAIWKAFMTAAHDGLPAEQLDGAWLPPPPTDTSRLLNFYSDISAALRRVRRSGDEGRGFEGN